RSPAIFSPRVSRWRGKNPERSASPTSRCCSPTCGPARRCSNRSRPNREQNMIPLASLERTAEALMAKAAIEIPDDYLDGLRQCADTEKGELSALVLQP